MVGGMLCKSDKPSIITIIIMVARTTVWGAMYINTGNVIIMMMIRHFIWHFILEGISQQVNFRFCFRL